MTNEPLEATTENAPATVLEVVVPSLYVYGEAPTKGSTLPLTTLPVNSNADLTTKAKL